MADAEDRVKTNADLLGAVARPCDHCGQLTVLMRDPGPRGVACSGCATTE